MAPALRAGRNLSVAEPELYEVITRQLRTGVPGSLPRAAHAVGALTILAALRLRWLTDDVENYWQGSREPQRLPPNELLAWFRRHQLRPVQEMLRDLVRHLVIEQHRRNVLRKLAASPTKFTARFLSEGDRIVPLALLRPDTSNPRYANAVQFLRDLGYLEATPALVPSDDGRALLLRIEEAAA